MRYCRHFRSTDAPKCETVVTFYKKVHHSRGEPPRTNGKKWEQRPLAATLVAAESADMRYCRHFLAFQTYRQRRYAILSSILQTEGSKLRDSRHFLAFQTYRQRQCAILSSLSKHRCSKMRDCCHFLQKSAPLSRGTAEDKREKMGTAPLSSYTCGCRKRRYAILSSLFSFSNL